MKHYGYGGKILRIDLTQRRFRVEELSRAWYKNVIGGRAANSKRLLEELDHGCDPLGPDNMLIFGTGPLTGTILPASAYYIVSAKSPLTGLLGDSAAGGQWAAEMRLTGFDQVIIKGKADGPVYLMITETGVQFVDCTHLMGKTIIDATDEIRKEQRDPAVQVAAIGSAGENQVLYSSIVSSGNRVNGRCGMGAVMGSKNLKAIAVLGKSTIQMADPLGFMEHVETMRKGILKSDEYKKRYNLGTTMLMKDLNGIGILPTNHFQKGVCDYVDEISGETLALKYKVKNKGCFNCNVHCSRYYICGDDEAEGPEYETLCGFSSRIGSNDLSFALEMNRYLNQVGMDSISSCEVIGWLMECRQKDLIKPADLDGIDVTWGDTAAVRKLIQIIATGEGIGKELGKGATIFSRNFSPEAQKLVMQVKGMDIICGDPRGIKAYGLTYAIASRGGDHLRAEPYFELTQRWDVAKKRFGTEKAADRLAEEGKAALVTYSEKIALLTDCLTMCKNIGLCMDVLDMESASALLTTGTGIDFKPNKLEKDLALCVERDFTLNEKFGLTNDQDTLPDRFLNEPLTEGPSKGSVVNIKKMVSEYHKLHNR